MKSGASLLAGAGVGVGLAYFLDPARGARRRARLRDTMTHSATVARRAVGTTGRDVRHRTYGTAAWLRTRWRHQPVDDEVLVSRVRSKLGRVVSHPHAIQVDASNGIVALRGPILDREADSLVRAVRRMSGVHEVIDELERHEHAGRVPSLQGGRAPAGDRLDMLQRKWAPATRLVLGAAGAAMAIAGMTRRDIRGAVAAVLGAGLVARTGTNLQAPASTPTSPG